MEIFYVGIIGFLFILAIFDLMVGVSNDAVNFFGFGCWREGGKLPHYHHRCGYWRALRCAVLEWNDGDCPSRHLSSRTLWICRNFNNLLGGNGHRCCAARPPDYTCASCNRHGRLFEVGRVERNGRNAPCTDSDTAYDSNLSNPRRAKRPESFAGLSESIVGVAGVVGVGNEIAACK